MEMYPLHRLLYLTPGLTGLAVDNDGLIDVRYTPMSYVHVGVS